MSEFPVITLVGSMRYYPAMIGAAEKLTANGWIVLSPFVADYTDNKPADDRKRMLDTMHMRKIDMSSAILIIGQHRGESTRKENEYAISQGKLIFVTVDDAIKWISVRTID